MRTQLSSHPTQSQLADFAAGKLTDAQAEAVTRHLDACDPCSKAVFALPADSMTGRIQAAQPVYQPVPTGSWAGDSPSMLSAILPLDDAGEQVEVPPELATHPKFRIVGLLGRGGMGVVYKAEHRIMKRPVAIKVINKGLLENAEALQRFHGEVRAAARLNHPHIVQAFDAEQAGDLHFLVMEFVEGKSLAEVLEKRQKPLPVQHACAYVRQAALGLQHAHEQQMVHRDIKPHNLMLTPKGQIKILDFGLARMVRERTTSKGITTADAFMGTPEYVAPEQAADARDADIRADLYSLGCTLYFLLAGRPPFRESTAMKVVLAHVQDVPRPLPEIRSDVPVELWQIVQKLLAKDPAQRFQQPTELAQALTSFARTASADSPLKQLKKANPVAVSGRATSVATDTSEMSRSRLFAEATAESISDRAATAEISEQDDQMTARRTLLVTGSRDWLFAAFIAQSLLIFIISQSAKAASLIDSPSAIYMLLTTFMLVIFVIASIVSYLGTDSGTVVLAVDSREVEIHMDGNDISGQFKHSDAVLIPVKSGMHKFVFEKHNFRMEFVSRTKRGDKQVISLTATLKTPINPNPEVEKDWPNNAGAFQIDPSDARNRGSLA